MINPISNASYLLPPLAVTALCLALAIVVWYKSNRISSRKIFCGVLLSVGLWSFLTFGMRSSPDVNQAVLWLRAILVIGLAIYILYYHFTVVYTNAKGQRIILVAAYAYVILGTALVPTNLVVEGTRWENYGYAPVMGPMGIPLTISGLLFIGLAIRNLLRQHHDSQAYEERTRIRYLIIAVLFPLLGAILDGFTNLPPASIWGNLIFCIICTVAILKYNLLDIRIVARKSLAYLLVSILIAIPYIAILYSLHYISEAKLEPWWVHPIIILLLAIVLRPLYSWAQHLIDRLFYRDRYDYLRALEQFSREAQSIVNLKELSSTLTRLVSSALRTSSACLLLPSESDNGFVSASATGLGNPTSGVALKNSSLLIKWLKLQQRILSSEELNIVPQLQSLSLRERNNLEQIGAKLYIPIFTAPDQLSGILVLGQKLSQQTYSSEERQLLTALSGQMAMALENARLYAASQQEVDERKRAEQALRESEEKYRALVENSPNLVVVYQDGHFTYVNRAACNKLGWTYEELTSPSFDAVEKLASEGSRHIVRENIAKRLRGEYIPPYEINMKTRVGSEFPVLVYGGAISYGEKPANEYNFVDITERKQAEAQVRESEIRYRLLAESISDVIWTVDINAPTQLTYISPSVTRLLGYTVEEATSKKMEEVFTPESFEIAMKALAEEMAIEGREQAKLYRSRILELQMNCKDGSVVPVEVRYSFVRGLDERSDQILAIGRDITERKRAEEELRQSHEQLRNLSAHIESARETERTSIAREVHDELGQALTALKMELSWMNKRLPKDQEALIKKTGEMSNLIGTTIQTVKRISTELRPGVLDDLGLMAAIEWQVQEFQERTRTKCELTAEGEDMNLGRDLATAVFRILQETLTNVARHANATRVKVSLKKGGGQLVLQVRDNGKGITKKQIAHPKSFGLIGMRERVRSWRGSVKIDGISGKGTIVTVSIPLNREE